MRDSCEVNSILTLKHAWLERWSDVGIDNGDAGKPQKIITLVDDTMRDVECICILAQV